MITTVTLNAAIDKTYVLSSFQQGKVNRVRNVYSEPGGKGINVAKVLNGLHQKVVATGFVGGFNGKSICARLDKLDIDHQFVHVEGESRLCLNIIDEYGDTQTEILEPGPVIGASDWQQLKDQVEHLAAKSEIVVFSGSLPKGISDDAYAQLIQIVHRHKARPIVDTSGSALERSLREKPFMVKPNRDELATLLKMEFVQERDILDVMKEWGEGGIPLIIVSLGKDGALVSHNGAFYKVTPPSVQAVNPVGSGDAMVAGMAAGIAAGFDIKETLILATAASTANAMEQRAGYADPENVNRYKEKVYIKSI